MFEEWIRRRPGFFRLPPGRMTAPPSMVLPWIAGSIAGAGSFLYFLTVVNPLGLRKPKTFTAEWKKAEAEYKRAMPRQGAPGKPVSQNPFFNNIPPEKVRLGWFYGTMMLLHARVHLFAETTRLPVYIV